LEPMVKVVSIRLEVKVVPRFTTLAVTSSVPGKSGV
jgi:hypothetical protein